MSVGRLSRMGVPVGFDPSPFNDEVRRSQTENFLATAGVKTKVGERGEIGSASGGGGGGCGFS